MRTRRSGQLHDAAGELVQVGQIEHGGRLSLFDAPADGAEVFLLMRMSALQPSAYLDAYFDTGEERQQQSP